MYKHINANILVRVVIATILIVAIAITTTVHAHAHNLNLNNQDIAVSNKPMIDFDKLQKELKDYALNEYSEENVIIMLRVIDAQIASLQNEITKLEQEMQDNETQIQVKEELNAKQSSLENKCEDTKTKIKALGVKLVNICHTNSVSLNTVVSQITAFKKLASSATEQKDKLDQTEIDVIRTESEIIGREQRLLNLKTKLNEKKNEFLVLSGNKPIDWETQSVTSNLLTIHIDDDNIVWADPCEYSQISSPFGMRIHPVYRVWKMHSGIDLPNKHKTPIYATRSGVVIDSDWDDSSGWHVTIDHLDGYKSTYLHMNSKSHLAVGDFVFIGDYIGPMGTTGTSTGTHLHFGVSENGEWVDPMLFIGNE